MNERILWTMYYARSLFQRYWNALMDISKVNWMIASKFNRPKISANEVQQYIGDSIRQNRAILVSRFGCFESRCMGEGYGIEYGAKKHFTKTAMIPIYKNAGVFPYGELGAQQFFELTKEAIDNIDLLGVWTTEMHDYLVDVKCPDTMRITNLHNLEPFRSKVPWSAALAGKKVVVVHPFEETISAQYAKREHLFSDPNVLPEFELRTVKAVQTIAGQKDERFSDWGQALQYMYDECMKEAFDVAIIGCGAYGMALASKIKNSGKVAIHLGGATQILFGIKGGRWDENEISALYNDYWVRPLPIETPQNAKSIENACYW